MHNTDKEIISAIKSGNIKEYEILFRNNYPALCGYANKIIKDSATAEEVVQEVFYILWKNRKNITIHSSLKSYLYKAVYNKCLHYFEHKRVVDKHAQHVNVMTNTTYTIEDAMYSGEMYAAYKKILNELPERCRQVFKLSRNYGFKYNEIAEKLSISVKTVEANMGKALKAFRQGLAEYK